MAKGAGIERRRYFGQALLFPAQLLCGGLETRGSGKHIVLKILFVHDRDPCMITLPRNSRPC